MGLLQKGWEWLWNAFGFQSDQFVRSYGGGSQTDAGETITPETSLGIVAVLRCATLIAGAAASLPIDVFEKRKAARIPVENHAVERALDSVPNREMSSMDFRSQQWLSFLLWGNAYSLKVMDEERLISLWPLLPSCMLVDRENGTGPLIYKYSAPSWPYSGPGVSGTTTYRADQICHVRWYSLDGIIGMSAIEQARNGIGLNRATEKSASSFFKHGSQLNQQLKIPAEIKEAGVDRIRKDFESEYGGSERHHRIFIAHSGSELSSVSVNPKDAQFIEQREFNDIQICELFGVPPHMIGLTAKSTSWGTGIAEQKQGFLDFTVAPLLTFFEKAYERCLLGDNEQRLYIKHNTKAFLRADIKTRMESHQIAIFSGMRSPNEALSLEDENPYDGGDVHVMQAQMTPVELLGKMQPAPARPEGGPSV